MQLPAGYDTVLSDDGINISGTEAASHHRKGDAAGFKNADPGRSYFQRGYQTEQQIQKAMRELMRGRTCFVMAHRLSTIRNADIILVIKDGRIAEQGTHDELMKLNGIYADMYNSQFI